MFLKQSDKTPVVVLGGSSNALAVARNLGRRGIPVYLMVQADNCATFTRFATKVFPFSDKKSVSDNWRELLLDNPLPELTGSVIMPCNDDGLEFLAKYNQQLAKRYILDDSIPDVHLTMLNKRRTMEKARDIGIPVPKFAVVDSEADIAKIDPKEIMFPTIVKPQHSHLFQKAFNGEKLFFADNWDELRMRLDQSLAKQQKVIVSEMIPGPDTQLASYYTYLDKDDNPLFHFTKAVIRRFPKNNGQGCYHVTRWDPEVAKVGMQFFRGMGLKGLGNVEFKKDLRDNKWKLIECNPRITAAHELLVQCGMETDWVIYCHLTGLQVPKIEKFEENVTLWFPRRDWLAYKELKALNEITLFEYLKSITKPQVLPHFRLADPMPTIAPFLDSVKGRLFGKSQPAVSSKVAKI